jgi:uncharacterized protein
VARVGECAPSSGGDAVSDETIRHVRLGEGWDTREELRNAALQAKERGLDDVLVVDADAHHHEGQQWPEILSYLEDPVLRQEALLGGFTKANPALKFIPGPPPGLFNQDSGGRVLRYGMVTVEEWRNEGDNRDLVLINRAMEAMSIDYQVLFPGAVLNLGLHPVPEIEVAVARAYARWMSERILDENDRLRSMLYLPLSNPEASLRIIEEFGDHPGIIGFLVTSVRYNPVHRNENAPVYRAIEESGKPLAFHAGLNWIGDRMLEQLNRTISVHALGFCFFQMVHLTNWIMNGIPERFPRLKVIWIESGLAWLPFMMQRLDHEYMMRSTDAPLLTRLPSEYMRDMYFTTQPLEVTNLDALRVTFELIDGENTLLYASDFPHWDFDVPSRIWDLPFLDEAAKRKILGLNAQRLFDLPATVRQTTSTSAAQPE